MLIISFLIFLIILVESSDLVQKLYEEAIHLLTQEKKDYTRLQKIQSFSNLV